MTPLSVGDFLSLLRQSNVLSAVQWDELRRELLAPGIARRFARRDGETPGAETPAGSITSTDHIITWLIDKGWLTRWQSDMLLSGRPTLYLGKYRLLECIGVGGMGAVFKARHGKLARLVALKVMSAAIVEKRKALDRFRNEIQAAAALNHPNIVTAFDADCVGNIHFLVMEYVNGHDLGWYVSQKQSLPIGWACECIRQAALGLEHAHERGMVHRDIKPTNVLVTRDPHSGRLIAKLLDLGLARFASEPDTEDDYEGPAPLRATELTQAGQVLGTPDYIAPEQAVDTRDADARSDVFGLGCTLFRLLTREFPFVGETALEKIRARQVGTARSLADLRPEAPAGLEAVVSKMLARNPDARYQTARDVARALEPFSNADPSTPVLPATAARDAHSSVSLLPSEDPRLEQFFSHLAAGAGSPVRVSRKSGDRPWRLPGRKRLAGMAIVLAIFAAVAFSYRAGRVTLVVDWPAAQRRQGTLSVNGRTVDIPAGEPIQVAGRSGRWEVRLTRPGYEPVREMMEMSFGEERILSPNWQPTARTLRQQELAALKQRIEDLATADPRSSLAVRLRDDLNQFRCRHHQTAEGVSAARMLSLVRSPLDLLSRADLKEPALRLAGEGSPDQAPAALVAVVGDGRDTCWNRVLSTSVSHDGHWFAAVSLDGTVRIYERSSGNEHRLLRLSSDPRVVCFSPVDHTLAVAGTRREITLWDPASGQLLATLRGAGQPFAFSTDGRQIAAGGHRGEIVLFETATGKIDQTLTGPSPSDVRTLAFSSDGQRLAASAGDGSVALWNVSSHTPPSRFPHLQQPRFSPAGDRLAAVSPEGDLHLWKCAAPAHQQTLQRGGEPLAFSSDGRTLFSYRKGRVFIWDVETGNELRAIEDVPALHAISPDGMTLAGGNPNAPELRFWNLMTGDSRSAPACRSAITSLSFTPDSRRLITGGADHVLRQWNPESGLEVEWQVTAWGPVAVDAEGRRVAIVRQGKVELRAVVAVDQSQPSLEGDASELEALTWSPTDHWLAGFGGTGFIKSALRMWDVSGGQEFSVTAGHGGILRQLTFDPSGQRLATLGDNRFVQIRDTAKHTVVQTLTQAPNRPSSLAFDRDRRWLASAGDEDSATIWDLQSDRIRRLDTGTKSGIRQLAFGPAGGRLVAATAEGLVLWDVSAEKRLRTLACKPGTPLCLCLNAAGDRLAAAGDTGTVWIWNWPDDKLPAEEPDLTLSIGPPGGLIRQVVWSVDGRHLLTVNGNSTLYVLRLPPETPDAE
jgi:WD40 repeat protein/serine/threonine protein kinase